MKLKDENTILEPNYDAIEKITWLNTDCQNLMNYTGQIFRGGMDSANPNFTLILAAANKAMTELNEDITNIKNYLDAITPVAPEESNNKKERK